MLISCAITGSVSRVHAEREFELSADITVGINGGKAVKDTVLPDVGEPAVKAAAEEIPNERRRIEVIAEFSDIADLFSVQPQIPTAVLHPALTTFRIKYLTL